MQFHHHGYVSGDPRVQPAAGVGLAEDRGLPDEVDVLVVGTGPAGMLLGAQLAQFPDLVCRVVERRPGRLAIGQADGIQARSVETFQAFGFAERIVAEAYRITAMNFWEPDPADPARIVRASRTVDDPAHVSEFPHLIVNQARVLDYFAEAMAFAPARMAPDYGWTFVGLRVEEEGRRPVVVTLRGEDGREREVRAAYVVGCDGARSAVRDAMGLKLVGDRADHAWAVMDTLAVTDFPDIRTKCAIRSQAGSILLIPREGGHLFRMYVDLGEVDSAGGAEKVRTTTPEQAIARANAILAPYSLDVRDVAWYSVYEVGHRLTERFDDVPAGEDRDPRVFIAGDACHTHSAKAGQGMNVSMQDGFNLGWKLAQVLRGESPASLLRTYSAERHAIAQELIDFDRTWSSMMAAKPGEASDEGLDEFYVRTAEFPAGFLTRYPESMVVGDAAHQELAPGFPVGKRFRSAPVVRVADAVPVGLGHRAQADGRWRIVVLADAAAPAAGSVLARWSDEVADPERSPLAELVPEGRTVDDLFDLVVVLPVLHDGVETTGLPDLFRPRVGELGLIDHERVFAIDPEHDLFADRGVDPASGAVVVVRPDQYVADVLPLSDPAALGALLRRCFLPQRTPVPAG